MCPKIPDDGQFYGHENVVRLLLENGANPNLDLTVGSDWAPKYRRTTLQLAEKGGNEAILSLLTKPAE
ncbi:hypothetical protein [Fluviibacterium sp. S390]|uniref:hypothetical protein n=1 Tax=Fluviibacterium sp. S390 TaxID=3415139 RepID=UPI003C7DA10E